jgi:23S rRNA pseudouridine2605 synthase
MEEILNGGQENHEERRDYASEGPKAGYSSEGRKLRPRKKVVPASSSSTDGEYKSYDNHRSYSGNNHGSSYGGRGGYQSRGGNGRGGYSSDHRSYGERSNGYGQRRSYGNNAEGEERRSSSYGHSRPSYGDRPSYGQHRSYGSSNYEGGERRSSYGHSSFNEGRPSYGQRRSYGNNAEGEERRPSYGQSRPSYGDRPSYGQRRSYGAGQEEGERRSSYSRRPASGHGFGAKQGGFSAGKGSSHPGPKRFGRKDEPHFTEADEAGINQMLSRKPQIDSAMSDNDNVPTPIKEEIRLNKYIANSGVCSRREADNFIQAGVVTVNGEVVTELGTKVNVLNDDVRFNGERLKGEEKVYIVMNKPKGFVTSASDPHAEKTVMDLLKGCKLRVFPVGRLDKNTTGVLMFTNDGEIAEQLTHPSYNKKKIYQVILDKPLEESDKEKILTEGLDLNDGNIKADELEYIDAEDRRRLGIEIHSGKNRIVRRIFESLGYDVKALDRVYFAGLTKKGLKKGEWRYLSEGEVNVLKMGAYV